MRKILITFTILSILIPSVTHSHSESDFKWYRDKKFNFKIYLPSTKEWKTSVHKLKKEYKIILQREKNTSITIRVLFFKGRPKRSNRWLSWYRDKILKDTKIIIKEKKDKNQNNTDSQFFLVEYKNKGVPILMRSMLTKFKKHLIVIEARACFNQFYKYRKIFDSVMASFHMLREFNHKR